MPYFLFLFLIFFSSTLIAQSPDQTGRELLQATKNLPFEQKIESLSSTFIGKPYQHEPLGEGPNGQYNQEDFYRFDQFDCETYVNTVIALSKAHDLPEFKRNIKDITYTGKNVNFRNRAHFPDADWVPYHIQKGTLQEITAAVAGPNNIATAKNYLDRKNWYQNLTLERIKIPGLNPSQQSAKLQQLKSEAQHVQNTFVSILYIPLNKLFINGQPNLAIFNRIPNTAIILLIVNDPNLKQKIGTNLNVSHMGFVIWKDQQLFLRAASSLKKQVIDLPLINYLQNSLATGKIKGIAIYRLMNH